MRVYHFLKRDYGLAAIRDRRLKIARLSNLNDPFEFMSFSMSNPHDRWVFENWRKEMDKDRGLLCFSAKATNPVLWSHYAENHTGLCLGFDVPDRKLTEVKYVMKRGDVNVAAVAKAGGQAELDMMSAALSTKYKHWEYEEEWRSFAALDHNAAIKGLYFLDFDPDLVLKKIIVGPKSSITRAEVGAAIGDTVGVEVYKARLAYRSFTVVKNRDEGLWD